MEKTPRAERSVKSAQRVLELLEFFAEWRRGATVKEISQSLGWPQSSTSVLLKCLRDSGHFDHDARTGLVQPNVRLALATAWIGEHLYTERPLLQLMQQVLDGSGHTVMIGRLQGAQVRYLHVLQSTRAERFTAKIGSLRPLFRSAPGKMLLATRTERELAQLLRRANALETDARLCMDEATARREREKALQQGWAISLGTSVPGAAGLAILLPVPRGQEPLTLGLGGPMEEIKAQREHLLALLREAVAPLAAAAQLGR
jgi:DNA-binding IclR family transcriptional regulator